MQIVNVECMSGFRFQLDTHLSAVCYTVEGVIGDSSHCVLFKSYMLLFFNITFE